MRDPETWATLTLEGAKGPGPQHVGIRVAPELEVLAVRALDALAAGFGPFARPVNADDLRIRALLAKTAPAGRVSWSALALLPPEPVLEVLRCPVCGTPCDRLDAEPGVFALKWRYRCGRCQRIMGALECWSAVTLLRRGKVRRTKGGASVGADDHDAAGRDEVGEADGLRQGLGLEPDGPGEEKSIRGSDV